MIKMSHLYFSYDETPVLTNINLKVDEGEKVGIIGESSSGKSTLQKIITGELKKDHGSLEINGDALPIYQSAMSSFNPAMTLQESLEEALKYYRKQDKNTRITWITKELPRYNLPESILGKYPDEVSGGELQRVNILRTMLQRPKIVVCDEITSNLDVFTEREIITFLNEEHAIVQNTMLIISHNIAMLSHVVDRIVVLYDHEIIDDFKVSDIMKPERHWYTKQLIDLF